MSELVSKHLADGVPAGVASPLVLVERLGVGVGAEAGLVVLNRPEALNAISWEMVLELERVLQGLDSDPAVRVVLVTGKGRAFSAGGDLKGYLELQSDADAFPRFVDDLMRTFGAIRTMSKPVLALVNGVTVAGGLELLLSCDFAYAARSARIGDGHLNYGQAGGGGALTLLPRMLPPARARELMFSGELLTADEALRIGLVNRLVDDDALLEAGLAFGANVASKSAAAIATAKYAMNAGLADGTGVDAAMRLERARVAQYCLTLPDSREGLLAFAAKRTRNLGVESLDGESIRPVPEPQRID
jgi:enoyl-CoA hydratase/carnithine racemase